MIDDLPLPATDDPLDAPYWEAARRGQLVVQRCQSCDRWRFPPRPMCPACHSLAAHWTPVSGRGRIWSFVVPHPPLLPAFARLARYNVVVVTLDEDPALRMVGNLVAAPGGAIDEVDPGTIAIGARVRVVFEPVTDDVALARWTPA